MSQSLSSFYLEVWEKSSTLLLPLLIYKNYGNNVAITFIKVDTFEDCLPTLLTQTTSRELTDSRLLDLPTFKISSQGFCSDQAWQKLPQIQIHIRAFLRVLVQNAGSLVIKRQF